LKPGKVGIFLILGPYWPFIMNGFLKAFMIHYILVYHFFIIDRFLVLEIDNRPFFHFGPFYIKAFFQRQREAGFGVGHRQSTLDCQYLTLLCDNLKKRMFLQNF
jgi:hypothetical protein